MTPPEWMLDIKHYCDTWQIGTGRERHKWPMIGVPKYYEVAYVILEKYVNDHVVIRVAHSGNCGIEKLPEFVMGCLDELKEKVEDYERNKK